MQSLLRCLTVFFLTCLPGALLLAQEEDPHGRGLPLVFSDDFEKGAANWEPTDPKAWRLAQDKGNQVFGLKQRKSAYTPEHRSPHNIALIKEVALEDFVLTYRVKSTKDTGNHRDCCTFFCHQDASHFYYVHMGARPDPHSGQIMIVNDAPRKAITENEKRVPWDDEWHTIKLVRDSRQGLIEIYFDDMKNATHDGQRPHLRARPHRHRLVRRHERL